MAVIRRGKLAQAVHALAEISFLDTDPGADLARAVRIASDALKAIDRDEMRVMFTTDGEPRALTIQVGSAAGNEGLARDMIPLVQRLVDSLVEAQGGQRPVWQEAEG